MFANNEHLSKHQKTNKLNMAVLIHVVALGIEKMWVFVSICLGINLI